MSVTFHTTRDDWRDPVAWLEAGEIAKLSDLLERHGAGFSIDAYGDTKLTDAHIQRVLSLPSSELGEPIVEAFTKMKDLEFVYLRGE